MRNRFAPATRVARTAQVARAALLSLSLAACAPEEEGEEPPEDPAVERPAAIADSLRTEAVSEPGVGTVPDDDAPEHEGDAPEGEGTAPEGDAPGASRGVAPADTIVLTARGPELAFYPDRVSVKSGSVVLLRFENGGELPHNVVLVRDDGAIDALASAAYEASESDYVPPDMRDELLAFSPLVSPGGSADLEVTVPPPGEYTYICLFPGHAQMMLGTLRSLP